MNAIETVVQRAHRNEKAAKTFITICGIGMALVPLLIGAFLFVKGTDTFFTFGHSVTEFLFSGQWKPSDTAEGGGQIGAAMFLAGSLVTCLLALLISLPFSLASSIYMTEIATPPAAPPDSAGYRIIYGHSFCCLWLCRHDSAHSGPAPYIPPCRLAFLS